MSIPSRRLIFALLLASALLLALPQSAWPGIHKNLNSVRIWQMVDIPRSLENLQDQLYPLPGTDLAAMPPETLAPCQYLWLSYLFSSTDLDRAQDAARQAQTCLRVEFIYRWMGVLTWMTGDTIHATLFWQRLSPTNLVYWGRGLALNGQTLWGKTLLEIAADSTAEQSLAATEQALLFKTLGDLEREDGNLEQSTAYYQQAWEASGYGYGEISYYLGDNYARQGDCALAIQVWEFGLQHKDQQIRPQLDTSYLLKLSECHLQLGNTIQAEIYLNAAQHNIETYQLSNTIHQDWLDSIRHRLLEQMP